MVDGLPNTEFPLWTTERVVWSGQNLLEALEVLSKVQKCPLHLQLTLLGTWMRRHERWF